MKPGITHAQKINRAAVMLAAAYWRGRFEAVAIKAAPGPAEDEIAAAAKKDARKWRAAAKYILGG